jgi:excisionase family DNA binding protein
MTSATRERGTATGTPGRVPDRYLSIPEVAERLGTSQRFARRLIEERRIEFKRFGRHVRIAESDLFAYIDSCTVPPYGGRR